MRNHSVYSRIWFCICLVFYCNKANAGTSGAGIDFAFSVLPPFITLLCTILTGYLTWKNYQLGRFSKTVTEQRVEYIGEMRKLFVSLFVELDRGKDLRSNELSKIIYELKFRLNPFKYPLWDRFIDQKLDKLHRIYVEGNPEKEDFTKDEVSALSHRVQSLLAIEWGGMREKENVFLMRRMRNFWITNLILN